ncbi:MAG: hypothetical protein M1836_005557 [Candelina mexicana]|nr:MAG: hypothetical protein M1836_005557 [Candelina mexicana]
MPIRNPFRKGGADPLQDENAPPSSRNGTESGFQKTELVGVKPSPALSINGSKDEPNEYKLSVVNDSGVYLPPSPPEKKSFWRRSNNSTASSNHRSMLSENEPFSISRESFDSYRRSFDISARSPVIQPEATPPRQSLDSRTNSRTNSYSRSAVNGRPFEPPQPTAEEGFEDVGLNDEVKPKKRGLFSRFGDTSDTTGSSESRPSSSHHSPIHGFHFTGRKRGQSGQGAELRQIDKQNTNPAAVDVIR